MRDRRRCSMGLRAPAFVSPASADLRKGPIDPVRRDWTAARRPHAGSMPSTADTRDATGLHAASSSTEGPVGGRLAQESVRLPVARPPVDDRCNENDSAGREDVARSAAPDGACPPEVRTDGRKPPTGSRSSRNSWWRCRLGRAQMTIASTGARLPECRVSSGTEGAFVGPRGSTEAGAGPPARSELASHVPVGDRAAVGCRKERFSCGCFRMSPACPSSCC